MDDITSKIKNQLDIKVRRREKAVKLASFTLAISTLSFLLLFLASGLWSQSPASDAAALEGERQPPLVIKNMETVYRVAFESIAAEKERAAWLWIAASLEPTPTPTPGPRNVGDYRCGSLAQARSAIEADGFVVGTVVGLPPGYTWTDENEPLVIAQVPNPGTNRPAGSAVDLTVYDPASYPGETCPPPG